MDVLLEHIDLGEARRYAGCPGGELPPSLEQKLQQAQSALLSSCRPRWHAVEVGLEQIPDLLVGRDLPRHLEGCRRAVLLGATLGAEADRLIRLWQVQDMAGAVLLDGCASAAIEQVCDLAQEQLAQQARQRGLWLTGRFSCGYGDLPLELQGRLITLLDAPRRIGLSVTPGGLLAPTKSVTAILGLSSSPIPVQAHGCARCAARETCPFRKRGVFCEK